jgi:hypothetical protein
MALLAWLLGGCASADWTVRDQFGAEYSCPNELVNVVHKAAPTDGQGQRLPGTEFTVAGCGAQARYRCRTSSAEGGGNTNVCVERILFALAATDGEVFTAMNDDPRASQIAHQAAVVSAAHDIPCDVAAVRVVSNQPTLVEGCGQRVTYKEEEHAIPAPPGVEIEGRMTGFREVLVGRVATTPPALTPP